MMITKKDMIVNNYGDYDYPKDEFGKESSVYDLRYETIEDCIFRIEQLAHWIRSDWSEPRYALSSIHETCAKLRSLTTS